MPLSIITQQQKSSYSENLRKADFDTDVLDYADEFCKDLNIEKNKMTLLISTSPNNKQKKYIFKVVFSELLKVDYEVSFDDKVKNFIQIEQCSKDFFI